jgi:hypothetical protein
MVNVRETNLDGYPKSHDRKPPVLFRSNKGAITERILPIHRVVKALKHARRSLFRPKDFLNGDKNWDNPALFLFRSLSFHEGP